MDREQMIMLSEKDRYTDVFLVYYCKGNILVKKGKYENERVLYSSWRDIPPLRPESREPYSKAIGTMLWESMVSQRGGCPQGNKHNHGAQTAIHQRDKRKGSQGSRPICRSKKWKKNLTRQ